MALSFSEIKTELPGKKSKNIIAKDIHYSSSSYIKKYPLVIDRGEGSGVLGMDGENVIRFSPPLVISPEEVDIAVQIFSELIAQYKKKEGAT